MNSRANFLNHFDNSKIVFSTIMLHSFD